MISGKPVKSSMARTGSPASVSADAVPPVETISTPSSASPRANSTSPRLSETVSSARRTRTSPGSTTSSASGSVVATFHLLDDHVPWRRRIDPHRAGREQFHGTRQQPMLDLVNPVLDRGDVPRIRINRECLLQDDRARVDALVDEVDRHPHLLDPVRERLLDRPDAGERRKQRRVHIDDAPAEAPDEPRTKQLHETSEHHEPGAALLQPVA